MEETKPLCVKCRPISSRRQCYYFVLLTVRRERIRSRSVSQGKVTERNHWLYKGTRRQPLPHRRQPLPHRFAGETFEGLHALSECKLAGTKIHKPEKDETPSLSDPGPLNVRRPHPHRVQPTEAGCRNVEPNRKEDHGKDCMYRGAKLATAPRTGGTPLRPCPTSGTSFDATAGRRVIGQ